MNRVIFGILTFGVLTMTACKSDKAKTETAPEVGNSPTEVILENDGGPADLAAIRAYGDSIDAALSTLAAKGPVPLTIGEDIFEGTAYSDEDGTPLLIYCQRNGVEQWYYLFNRRITQFRDRRPDGKRIEEQRWYYTYQGPVHGERLVAADAKGLKNAEVKEIKVSRIEDYYSMGAVTMRVLEVLFGRMPQ